MASQKKSETWFETYLAAHQFADWTRIPEGPTKRPDFEVRLDATPHYFEVKEFETQAPRGAGTFDPYTPIRLKINKAATQFKGYKEWPCCLVLANPSQAFVFIEEPIQIWGAMFGNLGFSVPFRPDHNGPVEVTNIFLQGGKLINDRRTAVLNTTISALIVLSSFNVHLQTVRLAAKEREAQIGRSLNVQEFLELSDRFPDSPDLYPFRVKVFENPYARRPLSRDHFRGPYDERWGVNGDGYLCRLFVGPEAQRFDILSR